MLQQQRSWDKEKYTEDCTTADGNHQSLIMQIA
jgi:hypothetical protein